MKAMEKAKIQKVLDKIQSADFDENDVEMLLIKLRDYSAEYHTVREVAHFVAHPGTRDQGIISEAFEAFYLTVRFFTTYMPPAKPLEIYQPIPLYVKKLMRYQIQKCDPAELRQKFSTTPEKSKKLLDTLFGDDKKTQTTCLRANKVGRDSIEFIKHLLGFINLGPVFSPSVLMNDLINLLIKNQLKFDRAMFLEQQPTIIICVMLLMHTKNFKLSDSMYGEAYIASEQTSCSLWDGCAGPWTRLGQLVVKAQIVYEFPVGAAKKMTYTLFESGLQAEEYCDGSAFHQRVLPDSLNVYVREIIPGANLQLYDGGKIGFLKN